MARTTGKKTGTEPPPVISAADAVISDEELAQRVAVLRRFRALLQEQRDRFRSYLEALDKQQDVIQSGSADDLLAHVELEEKIVADIFSIQKVIDPLEEMYHSLQAGSVSSSSRVSTTDDTPGLKAALEDLKKEAAVRASRNRELLSHRMIEIRSEISTLRNNPYTAGARRSASANTASLIDIEG